jgi:hypothetical protein
MRPVQKEVYNNGDLTKVEVIDADTGEHIVDVLWDPHDKQTPENRQEFRRYVDRVIKRKERENGN